MKIKPEKAKREGAGVQPAGADAQSAERIDSRRGVKDAMEHVMRALFLICGLVAVGFVLVISIYLIISGIPAIREVGLWNFLSGTDWHPNYKTDPAYGILPMILTSIYGTAGAIVIGVPIGFLMAVFLSKVANRKIAAVIREVVDL
ncbi:MAG TPA: hypothetical protein IAB77_07950, partial [Candidatus Scatomorpha intestinavium]|nr:hypothetical protein [Candidatus Scatomorpha intestinavium]